MNPFAQLDVHSDEDDYVQPTGSNANKPPKKSTRLLIKPTNNVKWPSSKKSKKRKMSPRLLMNLSMSRLLKKQKTIQKLETIGPSLKNN